MSRDWSDNIFISAIMAILYLVLSGIGVAIKYMVMLLCFAAVLWFGGQWLMGQNPELRQEKAGFWGAYNDVLDFTHQLNEQAAQIKAQQHIHPELAAPQPGDDTLVEDMLKRYQVGSGAVPVQALAAKVNASARLPQYLIILHHWENLPPEIQFLEFFKALMQDPDGDIRALARQALKVMEVPQAQMVLDDFPEHKNTEGKGKPAP